MSGSGNDLICDGCFQPIEQHENRIYRGWKFTGTAYYPPHRGNTTHVYRHCQSAYVARRLARRPRPRSQRWIARIEGVSRYRVKKWLDGTPFDPRTGRWLAP